MERTSFLEKIKQFRDTLILMHIKPDGDALGAAYAIYRFLNNRKMSSKIGICDSILEKYQFLFEENAQEIFVPFSQFSSKDFASLVVVDVSSQKLLGDFEAVTSLFQDKQIIIDHHRSFDDFSTEGALVIHQATKSSASEIILELIPSEEIDERMALALYAGIVFDTGNFRYQSTTAKLHHQVGDLLAKWPIDTDKVFTYLMDNESLARKKIIAKIYDNLMVLCQGEVVFSFLTKADLNALEKEGFSIEEDDLADLAHLGHSVRGVHFSCFVKENKDKGVSLSLRGRGFNVANLAEQFGGGGHIQAAGIKFSGRTLSDIQENVLPFFLSYYEKNRLGEI